MGLSPDIFWNMTPWQFNCYSRGYAKSVEQKHDGDAWMMWHSELLRRESKQMRPLKDFLFKNISIKKQSKKIDEADIVRRLNKHQKAWERENGSSRKTNG